MSWPTATTFWILPSQMFLLLHSGWGWPSKTRVPCCVTHGQEASKRRRAKPSDGTQMHIWFIVCVNLLLRTPFQQAVTFHGFGSSLTWKKLHSYLVFQQAVTFHWFRHSLTWNRVNWCSFAFGFSPGILSSARATSTPPGSSRGGGRRTANQWTNYIHSSGP